jgi:hypothetical protein
MSRSRSKSIHEKIIMEEIEEVEEMEVEDLQIPYMIISAVPNDNYTKHTITSIPGTVSNDKFVELFYELSVEYIMEYSKTRFETLDDFYNDFYTHCNSINIQPFTIYFFYKNVWGLFEYNKEDLLKLYHLYFDKTISPNKYDDIFVMEMEMDDSITL